MTGGVVLTVARMIVLQGIEDVLEGVINVTSVEKLVILKWCRRGTSQNFQQWERPGIKSQGRKVEQKISNSDKKINTNYVDGNGDGIESVEQDERPSTGPEYMFSVGDETRQSSGIVTLQVGGVHLPNVLIDSGATSTLLGKPMWEWLKTQKIQFKNQKDAKVLFAYGNTKPLPTLGTFTAHVVHRH